MEGVAWKALEINAAAERVDRLPASTFAVGKYAIYIRADATEDIPEVCQLLEYLSGAHLTDVGRARVAGFSGPGAVLLPGNAIEFKLEKEHAEKLFLATTVTAPSPQSHSESCRFALTLDGLPLATWEEAAGRSGSATARRVVLPAGCGGKVLRVEVSGPAMVSGLFGARIAPASPPTPARPDLVIFLADTYRADNLEAYGGDPRVAPHLNAFAADSVRWKRTWAPASWTLPSHAALFSALYPYENTVVRGSSSLPEEIETLAERLAAAGYRCGAITDGGCVSAAYGLDQGFEWFDEEWGTVERTLEAVERFLDGSDGRPTFLFVQSYRAHAPYVVSARAAPQLGLSETGVERTFALTQLLDARANGRQRDELPEDLRAAALELEALYRGASADLDAAFGSFLTVLKRHGLDDAWIAVASDHGEAFLEHGLREHGNGTFEEQIRVPLLLRGPDVEPGDRLTAASLVDLPRTFAQLADISPSPAWGGVSLLDSDLDRAACSFECDVKGGASTVALVVGEHKLIVPIEGSGLPTPELVFDLLSDPMERHNLKADEQQWGPAWEGNQHAAQELLVPKARSSTARLTASERHVLQGLGYTGD